MVSRAASVDAGPASVDAAALAQARAGHVRRCKVTQGRIITVDRDGDPQLEATIEVSRKRPNDTLPVPLEVAFAQHLAANWPGGPTKAPKFVNWGAGAAVTYEEPDLHAVVLQVVSSDPEDIGLGQAKGEWNEQLDITIRADPRSVKLVDYERELNPASVDLSSASAILDAVLGIAIRSDTGRTVLGELL